MKEEAFVCEDCGCLLALNDVYYSDDDEDTPLCLRCCNRRKKHPAIHEYGYKPEPIFYGEGGRYFGLELEIDDAGKSCYHAQQILDTANRTREYIYIKSDSSLDDGRALSCFRIFRSQKCPNEEVRNGGYRR